MNKTAYNGRFTFGEIAYAKLAKGAVTPQTRQCEIERL